MPTTRPKSNGGTKPRRKAKAAPPETAPPQAVPPANGLTEGAIAHRAYEIFMRRGGVHGRALDDWVAAERELASETSQGH